MRFQPKSDEELNNVWLADWYAATIESAEEKQSQSGNDMLALVVRVYGNGGQAKVLKDYLLEAVGGKLKHCCEAAGKLDRYQSGELTARDLMNANVEVKLKIKIDKTGEYPDKNEISDYRALKPDAPKAAPIGVPVAKQNAAKKAAVQAGDEEIPF